MATTESPSASGHNIVPRGIIRCCQGPWREDSKCAKGFLPEGSLQSGFVSAPFDSALSRAASFMAVLSRSRGSWDRCRRFASAHVWVHTGSAWCCRWAWEMSPRKRRSPVVGSRPIRCGSRMLGVHPPAADHDLDLSCAPDQTL